MPLKSSTNMPATDTARFEYFMRVDGGNAAWRLAKGCFNSSCAGNSNDVQRSDASRGNPELCVSKWSTVMMPSSSPAGLALNHGKYLATGSSSLNLPSSRSCIMAIALKSLLCEAMRNLVAAVIGTRAFTSAKPKPCDNINRWTIGAQHCEDIVTR